MGPYLLRLTCLCLAAWFFIHLVAGLAATAVAPFAPRLVASYKARTAARVLFALRLAPFVCALVAVALFCVPSYLWLEPGATAESVGTAGMLAALLGLGVLSQSFWRGARAIIQSARFSRQCSRTAREEARPGDAAPVWIVEQNSPCLALVGMTRPRIVLSHTVLQSLSAEELSAALAHEHAHRESRDNLKRLAVIMAPDLFPFVRSLRRLEREWAKLAEWAADDAAAAGGPLRPVTLAGALVRFARLGAASTVPAVATSMLACHHDLAERVERLLNGRPADARTPQEKRFGPAGIAVALGACAVALSVLPSTLPVVHRMLEHLMD